MRKLFNLGLFDFALIFFLFSNTHAQDFDTQIYSVYLQLDSVIVQPDTVFFLTPSDFDERTKFKITNTGSDTINIDTLLVTQNWYYEFHDPSGNFYSYPEPLSPGDSMTVAITVGMLTGGGSTGRLIIDTLTVVMDIGQQHIIIVLDEDLVNEVSEPTAEGMIPSFVLKQNYPNPFNPETTIAYRLPQAAEVTLTIYDLQGRSVRKLDYGRKSAGYHAVKWDSRNKQGLKVSSGIYFYRIEMKAKDGGQRPVVAVKKMILMK